MSYKAQSMSIHELMLDIGNYYLPAIQREFVWPIHKIEALFDSLLRGYPIGTLLRWDVRKPAIHDFQFYELIRNFDVRKSHNKKANLSIREQCYGVLDGQQRVTSLYIGLMGSYREKLPRMRWNNPDAFPEKKLYINLLFQPPVDDSDQRFQIKFLTETQAKQVDKAYWFKVGEILKYKNKDDLRAFRRSTPYRDNELFEDTLDTLWTAIHEFHSISYFAEARQDLDEVLRIFVRLNTGGTPLSYSDLLLSLATATWKTHDAREQVYALVDQLNMECGSFNFTKDFVLKTVLVLSDSDVRFKTTNIRKKQGLEDIWEKTQASLRITVKLLRAFSLNAQTLTAPYAAIPIAYYIYKHQLGEGFLTQQKYAADREKIRVWLLTVLLGTAFRGQTDQLLTNIREVIRRDSERRSSVSSFPAAAIMEELRLKHGFAFTEDDIVSTITDTWYGSPYAFATLGLLFPGLSYDYTGFHLDHMHPASHFTKRKLASAGLSTTDIAFALEHYDYLPNLQLLTDSENIAKSDQTLAGWLQSHANPNLMRTMNFIPNTTLDLQNFRVFYEQRQQMLVEALREKLGANTTIVDEDALLDVDDLITGEVVEI